MLHLENEPLDLVTVTNSLEQAQALNHAGGNISRTAQLLNLQRTTLIQKLNKLKGEDSDDMDSPPHSAAANG